MTFITGFAIWVGLSLVAAFLLRVLVPAPGAPAWLSYVLALFGAFIGGELGTAPYTNHDPNPWRLGALIGAAIGAVAAATIYHVTARKAV